MKIYKALALSLALSLVMGALIFSGLSVALCLMFSEGPLDSGMIYVALVLFIIYGIIQLILSATNLMQAIYLYKEGRLWERQSGLHDFFKAEAALYWIVFIVLSLTGGSIELCLIILVCSIPYIVCCTASVCMFRYFLRRINMTEVHEPLNASEQEAS